MPCGEKQMTCSFITERGPIDLIWTGLIPSRACQEGYSNLQYCHLT